MRIRRDAPFISGVLFTIALVALVPPSLRYALTWRQHMEMTGWLYVHMGLNALAFVLVGLIVVWTGYVQKVRWTWFVMFVIVWIYAFPVYTLPVLLEKPIWSLVLREALRGEAIGRAFVIGPLDFLLMAVALFMPVRSFFGKQPPSPAGTG